MSIPGFDQAQAHFDNDDGLRDFLCECGCPASVHAKDFGRRTMSESLSAVALLAVMLVPVCIVLAWLGGAP